MKHLFSKEVWKQFFKQKRQEIFSPSMRNDVLALMEIVGLFIGQCMFIVLIWYILGCVSALFCNFPNPFSIFHIEMGVLVSFYLGILVSLGYLLWKFLHWLYKNFCTAINHIRNKEYKEEMRAAGGDETDPESN